MALAGFSIQNVSIIGKAWADKTRRERRVVLDRIAVWLSRYGGIKESSESNDAQNSTPIPIASTEQVAFYAPKAFRYTQPLVPIFMF
jgi:hypothetical protein